MVLSLLMVGNFSIVFPSLSVPHNFTVHDLKKNTQVRLGIRLFMFQSMYWIWCCLQADKILTLDVGTDSLSRNVAKKLPLFAENWEQRISQILPKFPAPYTRLSRPSMEPHRGVKIRKYMLIEDSLIKANEMHYFTNLFGNELYMFGQIYCPSSGVCTLYTQQ